MMVLEISKMNESHHNIVTHTVPHAHSATCTQCHMHTVPDTHSHTHMHSLSRVIWHSQQGCKPGDVQTHDMLECRSLCVYGDGWERGVIGSLTHI